MSFPKAILSAVLCLLVAVPAVVAQNQYVVFYPGSNNPSTELYAYQAGLLLPQQQRRDVGAGTFLVLPTADGSKNYLVANGGGVGLTAVDGIFANPRALSSQIQSNPTTAALTPDGRRLAYLANRVYFFDTASDTLLNPSGLEVAGTPVDIAFSFDSAFAYVLSRAAAGGSGTVITTIDLGTLTVPRTASFRGENTSPATGIVMAPNGYLYVSNNNTIWEIDRRTLQLTLINNVSGEFAVNAYPDKGFATGDGKYLIFANKRPVAGNLAIIQFDLGNRSITNLPNTGSAEPFAAFYDRGTDINGATQLYGVTEGGRLFDIRLGSSVNVAFSQLNQDFGVGPTSTAFSNAAFSSENPARYAFLTRSDGGNLTLFQSDLREQGSPTRIGLPFGAGANFKMQYVNPAPLSGGTRMTAVNGGQNVTVGLQSPLPLIVRVLDGFGRGVSGARVTFTSPNLGVSFTNPTFITGSGGYAETYLTAPAVAGQFQVIASAGSAVPDLPINFTATGGTGGGGGGGPANGGIFIISGNGVLMPENGFSVQPPLVVQIRDAANKPVPDTEVTYTIVAGTGSLPGGPSITARTDAEGKATVTFSPTPVNPGNSFQLTTIEAAASVGKVNFFVTTYATSLPGGIPVPPPAVRLNRPQLSTRGLVVAGRVGETLPEAIQVEVVAGSGLTIPNVGVRAFFENTDGPTAVCDPDALTGSDGRANCNLKFGTKLGTGVMTLIVGEFIKYVVLVDVTPGGPARMTALNAATDLTGRSGARITLRTRVTDLGANQLAGVPVRWTVIRGTGTLSSAATTTDSSGGTQTDVTLGSVPGPLQVRASVNDVVFANFDINIIATIARVNAVAGDNQQIFVGRPFPAAVVAQVIDVNNAPLPNVPVAFTITGPATLASATATTDANGRAAVQVTAGATAGPVVVTATAGGQSTTFRLTVLPPTPNVIASGFTNGASFEAGLVPCSLAVISGANLAPGVNGTQNAEAIGALPLSLGPVEGVTIGGIAAPIQYVSNANGREQIGIQVPCELPTGQTRADIRITGLTATTVEGITVLPYQPGIFEYTASNGQRYALAYRTDGSLIGPGNPALRGQTVLVVATGLGVTNPAAGTNRVGIAGQAVAAELVGGLNDSGVRVIKAEYRQGVVGQYLVELDVPSDTPAGGARSLALAVVTPGGLLFGNGTQIPIQ